MKLIVDNIVKNFDKKEVLKNASFTFKKRKIFLVYKSKDCT